MNKRDRQTLLSNLKRNLLETLAAVAFIVAAFIVAFSVKCIAEAVHGEEVAEEIDTQREERCRYYDECMQRLSSSTLEGQHYHCLREADEKVKNQ